MVAKIPAMDCIYRPITDITLACSQNRVSLRFNYGDTRELAPGQFADLSNGKLHCHLLSRLSGFFPARTDLHPGVEQPHRPYFRFRPFARVVGLADVAL